jgi:hypothetical protein
MPDPMSIAFTLYQLAAFQDLVGDNKIMKVMSLKDWPPGAMDGQNAIKPKKTPAFEVMVNYG